MLGVCGCTSPNVSIIGVCVCVYVGGWMGVGRVWVCVWCVYNTPLSNLLCYHKYLNDKCIYNVLIIIIIS